MSRQWSTRELVGVLLQPVERALHTACAALDLEIVADGGDEAGEQWSMASEHRASEPEIRPHASDSVDLVGPPSTRSAAPRDVETSAPTNLRSDPAAAASPSDRGVRDRVASASAALPPLARAGSDETTSHTTRPTNGRLRLRPSRPRLNASERSPARPGSPTTEPASSSSAPSAAATSAAPVSPPASVSGSPSIDVSAPAPSRRAPTLRLRPRATRNEPPLEDRPTPTTTASLTSSNTHVSSPPPATSPSPPPSLPSGASSSAVHGPGSTTTASAPARPTESPTTNRAASQPTLAPPSAITADAAALLATNPLPPSTSAHAPQSSRAPHRVELPGVTPSSPTPQPLLIPLRPRTQTTSAPASSITDSAAPTSTSADSARTEESLSHGGSRPLGGSASLGNDRPSFNRTPPPQRLPLPSTRPSSSNAGPPLGATEGTSAARPAPPSFPVLEPDPIEEHTLTEVLARAARRHGIEI